MRSAARLMSSISISSASFQGNGPPGAVPEVMRDPLLYPAAELYFARKASANADQINAKCLSITCDGRLGLLRSYWCMLFERRFFQNVYSQVHAG
jgi:hypothetical protein